METQENKVVAVKTTSYVNLLDQEQFNTLQSVSKFFANSDLVPDIYRVNKDQSNEMKAMANCIIAIDMATRMRANVLAVMQNMYIVNGKPSFSSSFMISTVNTCGRFDTLKFKFGNDGQTMYNRIPMDNITCCAYTVEKGKPSEILMGSKVSISMAIKEGWYGKSGSKWQTMPEQMLMYRAAAFWVRVFAPEILNGMHTKEEWDDVDDQTQRMDVERVLHEEIDNNANKETLNISSIKMPDEQHEKTIETKKEAPKPMAEKDDMPNFMRNPE